MLHAKSKPCPHDGTRESRSDRALAARIMLVGTQTSLSLSLSVWTTLISAFLVPSHVGAQFWPDPWGQMWHDDLCGSGDSCHTGDFNGDGRDDIIAIDQDGFGHVALAGGARVLGTTVAPDGTTFDETQPGFGPSAVWGSAVCYPLYEKCVVGDFNGDGRDDVVAVGKVDGSIFQSSSLGDQFYAPTFWGYLTGPCDDQSLCNSADLNGDQIDDLLRFPRDAEGKVYVSLATGSETFWPEVNVASWYCMDG